MMNPGLLALLLTILLAPAALALDGRLQGLGGMDVVIVWRSSSAQSDGLDLIAAGVHRSNPALLMPLVSCIVRTGTRAMTTDAGFVTHDIMVIEGPDSGCRGNIPVEAFRTR